MQHGPHPSRARARRPWTALVGVATMFVSGLAPGLVSGLARAAPPDAAGQVDAPARAGQADAPARAGHLDGPARAGHLDGPARAGHLKIVTSALAIVVRAQPLDVEREPIDLGAPPISVELPAGRYRISAEGPGYHPWSGEIEIRGGERLELQVEPELIEVAQVELRAANEAGDGASVFLDGELLCSLPCTQSLDPGHYELEISKRRHKGLRFGLELVQADELIVDVALEPSTSRAPAIVTGAVALTSLTVAIGFTVRAEQTRKQLTADLDNFVQYDRDDRRLDNGRRDAVIATSLFGVTGAVGLMTLYYLLRQTGRASRADLQRRSLAGLDGGAQVQWTLAPALSPGSAGLIGAVSF